MPRPRRGRPMDSRNVKVVPEFRKDIDIERLGRVLIAAAINIAQKKLEETKKAAQTETGKGDDMT